VQAGEYPKGRKIKPPYSKNWDYHKVESRCFEVIIQTSAIFMPKWAERLNIMSSEHCTNQTETCADNILTTLELIEIAMHTVQKITNYPKSFGKTVDNYFHLLFPDEIKAYLIRRDINAISLSAMNECCHHDKRHSASPLPSLVKKVREIRALCQIYVEHQDNILRLISDKLDELEADLSETDANKKEVANGK